MATPGSTRLVLDVMVGGLTSILRMIGYDTVYALDRGIESDEAIIELARAEGRILVTRDVQIAERYESTVLLRSKDTDEQLRELVEAGFELELSEPKRCSRCNGPLQRVEDGSGPENGPHPDDQRVWRCQDCGQYFWIGSHWDHVRARVAAAGAGDSGDDAGDSDDGD